MSTENSDLLLKGSHLCEESIASIEKSESLILRCGAQLARSRFLLQQRAKRRASSSLLPVIRQRLQDGRLPHDSSPIIVGGPGGEGLCDACNKPLLKRQLVMEIPSGDRPFVRLHANCYLLWNAERHKVEKTARTA